jgi:hypothetical protein
VLDLDRRGRHAARMTRRAGRGKIGRHGADHAPLRRLR